MTLVSAEQVRRNIRNLVTFVGGESAAAETSRRTYFDSLNQMQKYEISFDPDSTEPLLDFALDDPRTCAIMGSLMRSPEIDDVGVIKKVGQDQIPARLRGLQSGRELLQQYDRETANIVGDLIAQIIVVSAEGYCGGSFWHILGAIWMSPSSNWNATDYAENLLHETVHQAMFLEDMVNGLFAESPAELACASAQITSSIRGTKRPYDYSFHAATVSVALIDFHERVGVQSRAAELCQPTLATLAELAERKHLLSPRGAQILWQMVNLMNSTTTFKALCGSVQASAGQ